tara:strand:+ start:387 stop:674 length:288 start_codon:yes stop_codon:yes gene_type:complete
MSKSIDNLVLLESNIEKLKLVIIELKNKNSKISNDISSKDQILLKQANELREWKEKYRSLKIANTFLGSDDKSLTKLKIKNMVEELDKCIMNLSS